MIEPKKLSTDELKKLYTNPSLSPMVTIYLPTHRSSAPQSLTEDEIRLKNLRSQAMDLLKTKKNGPHYVEEFGRSMDEFISSNNLIENRTEGLLIIGRPNTFNLYSLPINTQEYLSVDDFYHLAPIFGLAQQMKEYYVLVIAQHQPALLKGDLYGLYSTNLVLPPSIEVGLNIDEMGNENEQQRSAGGGSGFNGRGSDKDPADEERNKFWRLIGQQLNKHTDKSLPLILAGTTSEIAEFRSHCKYPNIALEHIEGSYGGINPHDLFPRVSAIIRQWSEKEQQQLIEEYQRVRGQSKELTASNNDAINKAANEGRIENLLLPCIRLTTGTIKNDADTVPELSFPSINNQLVNRVAQVVWQSSGKVVNIDSAQMPVKDAEMLAILRY